MMGAAGGSQAILVFDPDVTRDWTAFEVSYGVITPMHVKFREDQGFASQPWPPTTVALIRAKLLSPEAVRLGSPGRVPPARWALGNGQHNDEVGAALVAALKRNVLPRIDSWFDPEVLVNALESGEPDVFPGLVPKARAVPWHCWMFRPLGNEWVAL